MQNRLKILGLTGAIAAGKSTVANILRQNNGYVTDADKISHAVILKGNPAYNEILSAIPGKYLSGSGEIDRKKLGEIVFAEKEYLRKLEEIVHKRVVCHIIAEIDALNQNRSSYGFITIEAPLLAESGLDKKCGAVWIVEATPGVRLSRLIKRNGLTEEQAEARIRAGTGRVRPVEYVVIENNGTIEELHRLVIKNLSVFLEK